MITSTVMHFFNEELLIGSWIDYHKKYFDQAILIDHNSTDKSREIAESKLPDGWKIVTTKLKDFNAALTDVEVMHYEQQLEGWKMSLNTTEFLFCPDFRTKIKEWSDKNPGKALGSRSICLVDKDENIPIDSPIWKNRTHGFLNYDSGVIIRWWRWIHNSNHGQYLPGRHSTRLPAVEIPEFLHLHFLYSPWPECKPRKLQIQTRIPESDKIQKFGYQHIVTEEQLDQGRLHHLNFSKNLFEYPLYKEAYEKLLLEFDN